MRRSKILMRKPLFESIDEAKDVRGNGVYLIFSANTPANLGTGMTG
jgi:hypothetical protein